MPRHYALNWQSHESNFQTCCAIRRGCDEPSVADVEAAIPFYEQTFNFLVVGKPKSPVRSAVLARDKIEIGLAEVS